MNLKTSETENNRLDEGFYLLEMKTNYWKLK